MGSTNKKGFQNSRLVDKIKKNGSASLPQPNDRNVRISKKQVIKGRPINAPAISSPGSSHACVFSNLRTTGMSFSVAEFLDASLHYE